MQNSAEVRYDRLSEEFFDLYYTYHPPHATRQGLHQYDHHLGHYRRDEIEETLRRMKAVQAQVVQIDDGRMDRWHAIDHAVLTTRLKREIYWIESWRFWENNPLFYKDTIVEGVFNLVNRSFAPLEERLQLVITRERCVSQVLQAARENLTNPPYEYTEQAIRLIPGAISFFRNLPEQFESVQDHKLLKTFYDANERVVEELDDFLAFLQDDLMARSQGNFAVGEAGIQAILDAEEMIDMPVADILARCYRDLDEVEARIEEMARQVDPAATPDELRQRMLARHPSEEGLLPMMQREVAAMRAHLTDRDLLTLPPEMPDVIISPMPSYASGGGMMLTPGPFETVAEESYLMVHLPQPGWPAERVQDQLRNFNCYSTVLLFLHEAYPGHHTQFYMEQRVPMVASKDHDSDSNSDGWAEYGKYMMVDEIYAEQDPLFQFAALVSKRAYIVRAIIGLEIHLQTRTLAQAAEWMEHKAGIMSASAYGLLDRAVYYPTHLTYHIGCEMVRKLRADYEVARGGEFVLKEFHDRFMTYGLIPLAVIRRDMLGAADDGILF
jgi:uncharacterized protein (DUF885 family)